MFLAPEAGYQPRILVGAQKDSQAWSSRFNGGFYLKSRDGRCYGKIAVTVITGLVREGAVPVNLDGYINLASSRNLEIDPQKVTTIKYPR